MQVITSKKDEPPKDQRIVRGQRQAFFFELAEQHNLLVTRDPHWTHGNLFPPARGQLHGFRFCRRPARKAGESVRGNAAANAGCCAAPGRCECLQCGCIETGRDHDEVRPERLQLRKKNQRGHWFNPWHFRGGGGRGQSGGLLAAGQQQQRQACNTWQFDHGGKNSLRACSVRLGTGKECRQSVNNCESRQARSFIRRNGRLLVSSWFDCGTSSRP